MNTNRVRYRQRDFHLDDIDKTVDSGWSLERFGCGPTSIANILANYGFAVSPIDIAKLILYDEQGEFNAEFLRDRGIDSHGLIYCLDRLIREDKIKINYEMIKINFLHPDNQRAKIINLVKNGSMAIIHVGPSKTSPLTFSKHGHYLVISDVDKDENFYVINSNEIGDNQLGVPFSYDTIIKNMLGRKNSFNFLFIKKLDVSQD